MCLSLLRPRISLSSTIFSEADCAQVKSYLPEKCSHRRREQRVRTFCRASLVELFTVVDEVHARAVWPRVWHYRCQCCVPAAAWCSWRRTWRVVLSKDACSFSRSKDIARPTFSAISWSHVDSCENMVMARNICMWRTRSSVPKFVH